MTIDAQPASELDALLGIRVLEGVRNISEDHTVLIRLDGEIYEIFETTGNARVKVALARDRRGCPLLSSDRFLRIADQLEAAEPEFRRVCHFFRRPQIPCDVGRLVVQGDAYVRRADVVCAVDEANGMIVLEVGSEEERLLGRDTYDRVFLPMSSGVSVFRGETRQISGRTSYSFFPQRFIIGGNPDAWIVENIRVGGREQLRSGGASGRAFSCSAESPGASSFVRFDAARGCEDVQVRFTYVGGNPDGESFFSALIGPSVDAESAFVARWTPEGRRAPWEDLAPSDRAVALADRRAAAP